jgi:hypothetical protein
LDILTGTLNQRHQLSRCLRNQEKDRRKEKGERRKEKGERRKEKGERRKEKGEEVDSRINDSNDE